MANINRVRIALTGFIGGPGVMTFYCLTPATFVTALRAFCQGMSNFFPNSVTMTVEASGDVLDSTTGVITGTWVAASQLPVVGQLTGKYAAPVGMLVIWTTDSVFDGHRLRGKSFIVPAGSTVFEANGAVTASNASLLTTASQALLAAAPADMVIWHRPRKARAADPTHPAVTYRPGGHSIVTGSRGSDKVAVLRSRRD